RVGHDVDEVRLDLGAADRGDLRATERLGDPPGGDGDLGSHVAGVVTQSHRRGPGVGRLAGDRQLGPRDALDPGDDTDLHAGILEHRTLLDVQLDIAVREERAGARLRPGVADPDELVAEPGTV